MNVHPLINDGPLLYLFGSSTSLPPLVRVGSGLVCELIGKADLLSEHFDSKQSEESVDPPLTALDLPIFSFRSSDVKYFLLDLGMFNIFV